MDQIKNKIRIIPNFPKEGISFKDITPLLLDPIITKEIIKYFKIRYKGRRIDKIAGIESRGFIFGSMLAQTLGLGFIPIRKQNKLPPEVERVEYSSEYGTDVLEIRKDSIIPGEKILLVDDVLATGGTASAATQLIERLGGEVLECAFLMSLDFLNGKEKLSKHDIFSLIEFEK
tara:strand:+ start:342 stop:863 length:522 start_codon:yes stop_codon:yes gene_type:complete